MKTLSDFKKRIAKGVKIHTTFHQANAGTRDEQGIMNLKDEDKGIREVNIIQTNAFTLLTPNKDGNGFSDSFLHYPKATEAKIINEDTIQIMGEDFRVPTKTGRRQSEPLIPLLTYTFVK